LFHAGFIPSNYLQLKDKRPARPPVPSTPIPVSSVVAAPALVPKATAAVGAAEKFVRALFIYKAQRPDELSLQPGEEIIILDEKSDGWCFGEKLSSKQTGWFPALFVEEKPPVGSDAVEAEPQVGRSQHTSATSISTLPYYIHLVVMGPSVKLAISRFDSVYWSGRTLLNFASKPLCRLSSPLVNPRRRPHRSQRL
jgi:hypothetical protein